MLIIMIYLFVPQPDTGRSLIYSRKRAGPKTGPCGTPDVTGTLFEEVPSRTTI